MRTDGSDGGPAFPCEGGDMSGLHAAPGMSLLDFYFGHALTGVSALYGEDMEPKYIAALAWKIAEAAMDERSAH